MPEPNCNAHMESGSNRRRRTQIKGPVEFRWQKLKKGARAVPKVAVVGRDISAQFVFTNLSMQPIEELEIHVETDPLGQIEICECPEDKFRRDVQFESRFGDLFRTKRFGRRIIYHGEPIGIKHEVHGWLRIRVKKLEGPGDSTPEIPIEFVSVALTLRADYRFRNEDSKQSVLLRAEEVTFVRRGNILERTTSKVREEWIEFVAVSIFAWLVGLFSPTLYHSLKALVETIISFFR